MYPELIDIPLNDSTYDFLYHFFVRDFIKTRTCLNGVIYINPRSNIKEDGKEKVFWHLVTSDQYINGEKQRLLDTFRAERLHWVKLMIDQFTHESIKMFYYIEENNKIRLYLWAYEKDFVVILQKLGNKDAYLVTSFCIKYAKKRADFKKRHEDYMNKKNKRLNGCEWF